MEWRDDIAAALPDPVPEEHSDLHADLLDEIGDHLRCAMRRELLVTPDERTARDRVVERFGNPRSIVRQLWFEALKEKIVSQRITMVAAVVLAVASLIALGITWNVASNLRAANQRLLEESRQAQKSMMALLARRDEEPANVRSPDWNPLVVELVDAESGEPLDGWRVGVSGHLHSETESASFAEETDADGRVDVGMVRPGNHEVDVLTPWNELRRATVLVRPGTSTTQTIECPGAPTTTAEVELSVDVEGWDWRAEEGVGLVVSLRRANREVGDGWWSDGTDYAVLFVGDDPPVRIESHQFEGVIPLYSDPKPLVATRLELPVGQFTTNHVCFVRLPEDGRLVARAQLAVLAVDDPFGGRLSGGRLGRRAPRPIEQSFELDASDTVPTWKIHVPKAACDVARAGLASIRLGSRRNPSDVMRMLIFYQSDADGDGMLAREEYDVGASGSERPSDRLEGVEWPLDVETFVNRSSSRGGFSRSN